MNTYKYEEIPKESRVRTVDMDAVLYALSHVMGVRTKDGAIEPCPYLACEDCMFGDTVGENATICSHRMEAYLLERVNND